MKNLQKETLPDRQNGAMREKILLCLRKAEHSLSIREMRQALRLTSVQKKKNFFCALDEMKAAGEIVASGKNRFCVPEKAEMVEATVVTLSRYFAFVRPDSGSNDIFIPSEKLNGAVVGDRVTLCNLQEGGKGPSAEVKAVTEKGPRVVTGTLRQEEGKTVFLPDCAIRYGLAITKKSAPLAKEGDKVEARLCRNAHTGELEAELLKDYGRAGSAKICADAILDRYGIASRFSKEALAEAEASSSRKISEDDLKGRLDLRKAPVCTIDDAGAKDLDDAISVGRTRDGGFRLGVHIADVSNYLAPDGVLDQEARSRGTSVYFADRVVPMLPEALSNGACSLNAGEDKLTFSALVDLDGEGNILSYRFRKSVICSKVRGVYAEVNSLFDGTADRDLCRKYFPVIRSLHAARELAAVLKKQSERSGTIDLESTEPEFTLGADGVCRDVRPRKSGEAERMIECLMITANRAAAMLAESEGIPFLYRVHEQPDSERVETLIHLADAAGIDAGALRRHGKKPAPADFSALLAQAKGTPAEKVISHQVLRTMAKARYDTQALGHFGLALKDYCHFTSPIRRYPDTAIHRILSSLLATKDKAALDARFTSFAAEAARSSSEAEMRAMAAERDAEDCYMAEYMTQHIGETYDGVVSGVTQHGLFVELENSVEGFVPMESFPDADYRFDGELSQVDAKTHKRITIGCPLRVRAVSADVASGRIDFVYAGQEK